MLKKFQGSSNAIQTRDFITNNEYTSWLIREAFQGAQGLLTQFSNDEALSSKVSLAFGNRFNLEKLESLIQDWSQGDFSNFPQILILPAEDINYARGAYSSETNTIYLSQDLISHNSSNVQPIVEVVLEEIGHFIDAQINIQDTPGDEGEIFSKIVSGESIDDHQLQNLRSQQDAILVTVNGETVTAEAATTDTGLIASSIEPFLEQIKNTLTGKVEDALLSQVPLLNGVDLAQYIRESINQLFTDVENRIVSTLNQTEGDGIEAVEKALVTTLGELLIDANGDGKRDVNDISNGASNPNKIQFDFSLGKTFLKNLAFAEKIGLPNLGLSLTGSPGVKLALDLDVSFGIDKSLEQGAFFFNFDPAKDDDLEVKLDTKLTNISNQPLTLAGKLGFLEIAATDNGTNFTGDIGVDLTSSDPQGLLRATNLTSLSASSPQVNSSADLKLKVNTGVDSNGILPTITTDLDLLNWRYSNTPSTLVALQAVDSPTVDFKNVKLDLGSFFDNFAGSILKDVQSVANPITETVEQLDKPLPLVGSLIDIAGLLGSSKNVAEFLGQFSDIAELLKAVESTDTGGLTIDLGDFNLLSADQNGTLTKTRSADSPSNQAAANGVSTAFFDIRQNSQNDLDSDLRFPILENPESAIQLLLGRNVELFTYRTPKLEFGFTEGLPPIPIFGPVVLMFGGGANASAQLKFGFDTEGFKTGSISDGFYVSRPTDLADQLTSEQNLVVGGEITGEVGVSLGVASVSAGGGLGLKIGMGVANKQLPETDPDRFKVRGSTIAANSNPLCLFDVSGAVSLLVYAAIRLKFGFFKLTKRFNLAEVNLIDFSIGAGDCSKQIGEFFNVDNPDPALIKQLEAQGVVDRRGTSSNDIIFVRHTKDAAPINGVPIDGEVQVEGLDPEPKIYSTVELIVIKSGEGDDLIDLIDIIASSQLNGGAGNDVLVGGLGDDFLEGGVGTNTLDGGKGGSNTAVYANSSVGVTVDLVRGEAKDGIYANESGKIINDRLFNIQNVEGSKYDDVLIAINDPGGSSLLAGEGNDQLLGGIGDDVLLGGRGSDYMSGGAGLNTTTYIDSTAILVNASNRVVVIFSPFDDSPILLEANTGYGGDAEGDYLINISHIQGSMGNDIIVGTDVQGSPLWANDKTKKNNLDGLSGDDVLVAGAAAENIDGSDGENDWLSYITSASGVNVNLGTGLASGGNAAGDSIEFIKQTDANGNSVSVDGDSAIENLDSSNSADTLIGDLSDNIIKGRAGNDVIFSGAGDDLLIGGAGADDLNGGEEGGSLLATTNAFEDGGGDIASYADSATGVSINLQSTLGRFGDAEGDRLFNIENLIGSVYGDTLTGNDENNDIKPGFSSGGIDVVDGGGGDSDRLTIDYTNKDYFEYAGIYGGFIGGSGQGYLIRNGSGEVTNPIEQYSENYQFLDHIKFSNIERLYVVGTSKRDQLYGGNGSDLFYTSAGNDFIDGGFGGDVIDANDGNDEVISQMVGGQFANPPSDSSITLDGGRGIDTLSVDLSAKTSNISLISNNPNQDNLTQSTSLSGGGSIRGFEIFKDIRTGSGNDTLVQAGRINNRFIAGAGNDTVNAGLGIDDVDGGSDTDTLKIDFSIEDTGAAINMSAQSFNISGKSGVISRTTTTGTPQDQITFRNVEQFEITGTSKDDRLIGLGGLFNSSGKDVLIGGAGADTFVLADSSSNYYSRVENNDYVVIRDFDPREGDVLNLAGECGYIVDARSPIASEPGVALYKVTSIVSGGLPEGVTVETRRDLVAIIQGENFSADSLAQAIKCSDPVIK